jgi:hypothetical protein
MHQPVSPPQPAFHQSPRHRWEAEPAAQPPARGTVPFPAAAPQPLRPPTRVPVVALEPAKRDHGALGNHSTPAVATAAQPAKATAESTAATGGGAWGKTAVYGAVALACGTAMWLLLRRYKQHQQQPPQPRQASASLVTAVYGAPDGTEPPTTPNGSPTIPNRYGKFGPYDHCDGVTDVRFDAATKKGGDSQPVDSVSSALHNGGAEFDDCCHPASPNAAAPSVARMGWQAVQ